MIVNLVFVVLMAWLFSLVGAPDVFFAVFMAALLHLYVLQRPILAAERRLLR